MRLKKVFKNKVTRNWGLVLLLLGLTFLLFVAIGGYESFKIRVTHLQDGYLTVIGDLANRYFNWRGTGIEILDHRVVYSGQVLHEFSWIAFKKWVIGLLLLFWITPARLSRKLIFSLGVLLVNFLGSFLDIICTSYSLVRGADEYDASLIGYTPHLLLLLVLMTTWIWRERKRILQVFNYIRISPQFIENKLPAIFVIIFIYAQMSNLLLGYFQYTAWINFLFHSSAGIIKLTGYTVTVDSQMLIGPNGSIYMAKPCLGISTMVLFASIVFITGRRKDNSRWYYILFGVLFLNLVNIIRFVLLFIHIQKHGDYVLAMDLHDMFKYITYTIVFLLWIIWFEKFSDLRDGSGSDPVVHNR
jgi:exosortase/archaeosortase family protein